MVNLDIGCGWHKQPDAIGIDLRHYDIYLQRHHTNDIIGSADYLPFVADAFNKVYCFEVLEHCYNPKGVLDEINRVMAKNGYFYLSIPNPYWIMRFIRHCFYDYADYGANEHIYGWTFAEINSLLRVCNFIIIHHYFISFMYRVKKRKWIKKRISKVFKHLTNYSLMVVLRKNVKISLP